MLRGFIRPMRLFPKARRRFRVLLRPGVAGLEPLLSCPRGEAAAAGRAGDPLLGQADLWAVGRSSGISSFCSHGGLRGRFRTAPPRPRLPRGCASAAVPLLGPSRPPQRCGCPVHHRTQLCSPGLCRHIGLQAGVPSDRQVTVVRKGSPPGVPTGITK